MELKLGISNFSIITTREYPFLCFHYANTSLELVYSVAKSILML